MQYRVLKEAALERTYYWPQYKKTIWMVGIISMKKVGLDKYMYVELLIKKQKNI